MLSYEVGDIAVSKAGHDKGSKYIIMEVSKDFVYLADGRLKKTDKPKKKNIKHIQILHINDNSVKEKVLSGITNEEIKYFLKTFGGKNV